MRGVIAAAVVLAACAAVLVAYVTLAELGSGDSGSHPTPLLVAQMAVAAAGLVPVAVLARLIVRGFRRSAFVAGAVAVLVYLAWGVLNDASVHGWGHLKVF